MWDVVLDVELMVSEGIEIVSMGGGCLDCVEAIVELVREWDDGLMDCDLESEIEEICCMSSSVAWNTPSSHWTTNCHLPDSE